VTGRPGCGHWGDSGKIFKVETTKLADGANLVSEWAGSFEGPTPKSPGKEELGTLSLV